MIGDNIAALRAYHKLSQEDVAEAVGVSRQTIAKWESGESSPELGHAAKLAALFKVSLDELVQYSPEDNGGLLIPPNGKFAFGMVTVGERGQIVIPAKARRVFDIKPGDAMIVLGDIQRGLALVKAEEMLNFMRGDDRIE